MSVGDPPTGLDVAAVMQAIEKLADDCKVELHKIVPIKHDQQIKVAVAFETMLDQIEDIIRNACDNTKL